MPFKIGDWVYVYSNESVYTGYIVSFLDDKRVEVQMIDPKYKKTMEIRIELLVETNILLDNKDLESMIDIALLTRDKSWFNKLMELMDRYKAWQSIGMNV